MLLVRGDQDVVTGCHFEGMVFKLQDGRTGDQHYPFMLLLVIPETVRGDMAVGYNTLDPYIRPLSQNFDKFFC